MRFPSDDELMDGPNAFEGFEDEDFEDAELIEDDPNEQRDPSDTDERDAGLIGADYDEKFRAGFIAIVGRPNVGKSTLTNALVGQKIAITSMRPETTRHAVRGVVQGEDYQLVLVDTPGYHRPRTLLGQRLNSEVRETLSSVDAILFCLPADQKVGPGDDFIARQLRGIKAPIIAVATKVDAVSDERVMKHLLDIDKLGDWEEIIPVSAIKGHQIDRLKQLLARRMPLSPPLYPRDMVTDESRDTMIAELIREAALEGVHEELPHSLAVQVEEIVERQKKPGQNYPAMLDIHVNLFVERDSQKAIIIGKGGSRLKHVGMRARRGIEEYLGRRVYLHLHVRTLKDWQKDPKMLGRLGF
ncbi:MAG: GTPase Era [Actinomyces sp.]|uniref:GTPase Era n=1 Tax=Actinomyces sp. TaxID=29317 RepID=UPI001EC820CC|nr:GTPase Era [Actinomyces sp.]MBS5826078.1 GTPase Era [Actinomyces sp.]